MGKLCSACCQWVLTGIPELQDARFQERSDLLLQVTAGQIGQINSDTLVAFTVAQQAEGRFFNAKTAVDTILDLGKCVADGTVDFCFSIVLAGVWYQQDAYATLQVKPFLNDEWVIHAMPGCTFIGVRPEVYKSRTGR